MTAESDAQRSRLLRALHAAVRDLTNDALVSLVLHARELGEQHGGSNVDNVGRTDER